MFFNSLPRYQIPVMRKLYLLLFISPILILLNSCEPQTDEKTEIMGYSPIYSTNVASVMKISAGPPRPTVNAGKIYTVGSMLFQVEKDSGIHVINYADPSNPVKLGFIRSFLCKEVSVKNGYIYTNNRSDLVVIDINNMNDIKETGRTQNVFPNLAYQYPEASPNAATYFECPDPSKGIVIGWTEKKLTNPKCWR